MAEEETGRASIIGFVFPGQGSQEVGMGCDLFQNSSAAREVFEKADDALGFSLSRLCFEGTAEELRETINSQPAILTTSIAYLRACPGLNGGIKPALVAGHSLGEYTALVSAGAIDFADAVRLVRERGRLMQEAGKLRPGGMAAIIGLDEQSVLEICMETNAQVANINCPGQTVVSGTKEAVARSIDLAQARGAVGAVPLEVSGAFHSVLMEPVVEGMARALSEVEFRKPEMPIVANSTAMPVTTEDEVKDELLRQLCSCVRWQPTVEYMAQSGVNTFIEIGPGIVLTKLIKRIVRKAQVLNMSDLDTIRELTC